MRTAAKMRISRAVRREVVGLGRKGSVKVGGSATRNGRGLIWGMGIGSWLWRVAR